VYPEGAVTVHDREIELDKVLPETIKKALSEITSSDAISNRPHLKTFPLSIQIIAQKLKIQTEGSNAVKQDSY
jgi:hypothetical protein